MIKANKIMIVDDHKIFREGLASLLIHAYKDVEVFHARDGLEAVSLVDKEHFDVILMDLEMPNMNGYDATKIICKRNPGIKILILSIRDDHASILETCSYGASGYILKNTDLKELKCAIDTVLSGEKYFQNEITKIMVKGFVDHETGIVPFHLKDAITGKERQVLYMICEGLTADEIGKRMGLSKKTVEGLKSKLYLKTGTNNERSLISYAYKNKIVRC